MTNIVVQDGSGGLLDALSSFSRDVRQKALVSTLRRIGDAGRAEAVRAIRERYNIKAGDARDRIKVSMPTSARPTAEIRVTSRYGRRSANVIAFGANELKRGGVSVRILRGGPRLKGKLWWIMRKGGTEFVVRRVGKQVKGVMTIDLGQMFNARVVNDRITTLIATRFPLEFQRQVAYWAERLGK